MEENTTKLTLPKERVKEILGALFPWGHSNKDDMYFIGPSPYINDGVNTIQVVTDPNYSGDPYVLSICMIKFDESYNEADSLGYYKGIMKIIAPELMSTDHKFEGTSDVLDFTWSTEPVNRNWFPVTTVRSVI